MMAMNILLSGNNYYKVSHLFNYMNMGFVGKDTFSGYLLLRSNKGHVGGQKMCCNSTYEE